MRARERKTERDLWSEAAEAEEVEAVAANVVGAHTRTHTHT